MRNPTNTVGGVQLRRSCVPKPKVVVLSYLGGIAAMILATPTGLRQCYALKGALKSGTAATPSGLEKSSPPFPG